jgi:MoxR-like ATPase
MTSEPHPRHVAAPAEAILDEVERAVVGKRDVIELVLLALLADGHVLLEDVPGVAKTLIARSFATATGAALRPRAVHARPAALDVTGSSVFDQRTASFEFRPGRCSATCSSATRSTAPHRRRRPRSLEAMEERQVTADDGTHELERPFLVLATQNPIEYEGTYPLPEAQLDRFLVRLRVGYPTGEDEWACSTPARAAAPTRSRCIRSSTATAAQPAGRRRGVHVGAAVGRYMVALATATRESSEVEVGASPRGSLALLRLSRAAGRARGTRLRGARRRQGRRRPGARPPARAAPGAVGAAHRRRRRRGAGARRRARPAGDRAAGR